MTGKKILLIALVINLAFLGSYIMINPICPSLAGVSPANRPARCALSPFRVVLTFRYKLRASKTA